MEFLNPQTIQGLIQQGIAMATTHGVNVLIAIVIFIVGRIVAKRLSEMTRALMIKGKVDETLRGFLRNIIYYALLAAVVVMALGQAGLNITSFLAVLGAAGLAIGLALKDSLSNFASGVMLILLNFFKKGDYVEIADESGTVESIKIFNTVLNTIDNKRIIVPNGLILAEPITNYTANPTRRVDLTFGIGYDDDLRTAKEIVQRAISEDARIMTEPPPQIVISNLGDSSVDILCRSWVNTSDFWDVRFALIEKIKLAFDDEGITIPYPQTDVHLYKSE